MVKITLKCSDHPKYTAERKPKGWQRSGAEPYRNGTACQACAEIYDFVNAPGATARTAHVSLDGSRLDPYPAKIGGAIHHPYADDSVMIVDRKH